MKRRQGIPRPLDAGMKDWYTKSELLAICENELFANAKRMDTALLREALDALDERPDEEAAPHRSYVWANICERIRAYAGRTRRKTALMVALILLLLALVGGCLAWATRAGILSFPSIALPWLPQVESDAAQSLVQTDLFQAQYEHCELRVREAAFDGHQLRIIYSLRDTRENATLTDADLMSSSIAAARLDGIGCCDYLMLDGQDVYLDDTFQRPGEQDGEMLYYIAANIPEEIQMQDMVTVKLPIGEIDLQAKKRLHDEVFFSLDTTVANANALSAKKVSVVWDDLCVDVVRAEFSPLHGLVQVRYSAAEPGKPYTHKELRLFSWEGIPVGQEWYSAYGGSALIVEEIVTQYIPNGPWPERMVLAPALTDGSMDSGHVIPLVWKPQK